ncbi:MAG: lipid-A-disaccharide synthase [Prolixibacteraceae bacterium]|nr:lipid-A-disaccharide synthase [Prolixibacteraceae bacterium]
MKYFIIAGEPSGDMHAAALMKEIKVLDAKAMFVYMGGDLMAEQGGQMIVHYREMAFMGLLPVIMNIGKINRNLKQAKKELLKAKPDVLILIDYPGFNLRMARFAKENNIKTAYYISPKVWAWNTKRATKIKAFVDNMYTILPFETEFYNKYNYNVHYVGNPVCDIINGFKPECLDEKTFKEKHRLNEKPIIAMLAGSRKHEIKSLLPVMEKSARLFPDYQFVVAGAPGIEPEFYRSILNPTTKIVYGKTYELLKYSKAALVTSGTATLETALLKVPQLVCYKMGMGFILQFFRKLILKTPWFSLVNLIAGKEVVKEFFQSEVTLRNLEKELRRITGDEKYRKIMIDEYSKIEQKLKTNGAARNAAQMIVESLKADNK